MLCTNCGARLMDTDQFCPKCGTRAIKDKRCPDCGAVLRDGTRFCHKCGRLVDGTDSAREVSDETLDIPIDAIERNILSETAAEIRADHRVESASRSTAKKNAAVKKRVDDREEDREEDDWDDEEEGTDIITVMTAIVGCVLLVVVALLGYHFYQQYAPSNYEEAEEESEYEETAPQGQETEEEQEWAVEVSDSYVTVIKNVNVRDNPSTSDSNILKVAKEGEVYPYHGSVDGGEWYEILLDDGTVGYVFHEYVTVND